MPARRRAPQGCGSHAPGKLLKFAGYVSIGHEAAAKCQIILARALSTSLTPTPNQHHRRGTQTHCRSGRAGHRRLSAFICGSFQTLSRALARRIAKQTLSRLNLEVRGAGAAEFSDRIANPDAGQRRGRTREVDGPREGASRSGTKTHFHGLVRSAGEA